MKPCRSFAADLDALAAGTRVPERVRAVEAHLAGCTACREQYAQTVALCAELSAAGQAVEPPDAAVWRLRNCLRTTLAAPMTKVRWRWQTAAAFVAGVVCTLPFVRHVEPPRPMETASIAPAAANPPLTLLACERAAARSDAALDQLLSREAVRPRDVARERPWRAFSPTILAALEHDTLLP